MGAESVGGQSDQVSFECDILTEQSLIIIEVYFGQFQFHFPNNVPFIFELFFSMPGDRRVNNSNIGINIRNSFKREWYVKNLS